MDGGLLTIEYIRRKGLQSLSKDLAISVTPHPDYVTLLHLSPHPTTSPSDHPVVRECAYSMLIEEFDQTDDAGSITKDWRVVAMSYKKIDYLIDPFTLTINFPRTKLDRYKSSDAGFCWDKNEIRIFEKLDGKLALLYHYGNQWRVASAQSPDASEAIIEESSLSKR